MTSPGSVPFVALLAPPLLAALVAPVRAAYPRTLAGLHALLVLIPVAAAGWLAALVVGGAVPTWGPSGLFRIDALSALLALCVAGVSALAALGRDRGADACGRATRAASTSSRASSRSRCSWR